MNAGMRSWSERFWRLRCLKMAPRCGAKLVWKSNPYRPEGTGHFWTIRCLEIAPVEKLGGGSSSYQSYPPHHCVRFLLCCALSAALLLLLLLLVLLLLLRRFSIMMITNISQRLISLNSSHSHHLTQLISLLRFGQECILNAVFLEYYLPRGVHSECILP